MADRVNVYWCVSLDIAYILALKETQNPKFLIIFFFFFFSICKHLFIFM